jgi:hypothetical protein
MAKNIDFLQSTISLSLRSEHAALSYNMHEVIYNGIVLPCCVKVSLCNGHCTVFRSLYLPNSVYHLSFSTRFLTLNLFILRWWGKTLTAASNGLFVHPPDDKCMSVNHWWHYSGRGNPRYFEKDLLRCHFVGYRCQAGANVDLRCEKSANDLRLKFSLVQCFPKIFCSQTPFGFEK